MWEKKIFERLLPPGQKALGVFHKDVFTILNPIIKWGVLVIIISMLYFQIQTSNAFNLGEHVPFFYLEGTIFIIWIRLLYILFDWYNDVWIISDKWVLDVRWKFFKTKTFFTEYESIEGIEIQESHWWYNLINTADIRIHKISSDLRISRLHKAKKASRIIQNERESMPITFSDIPRDEKENMNIYINGSAHEFSHNPDTETHPHTPDEKEEKYLHHIQNQENTIDLR